LATAARSGATTDSALSADRFRCLLSLLLLLLLLILLWTSHYGCHPCAIVTSTIPQSIPMPVVVVVVDFALDEQLWVSAI
jgi:hypothetical protein